MKHFAKSIAINENQSDVSSLISSSLDNLNHIERDDSGVVEQLYISQSNPHDPQTTMTVYFSSNVQESSSEDEVQYKFFEGEGISPIEAYSSAAKLLESWIEDKEIVDIFDIKFDFYVGSSDKEIAVAHVFYSAGKA